MASRVLPSGQRWIQLGGLGLLLVVVVAVLRPFIVPVAWAAILATATWPAFRWLERSLGGRPGWAAALMTVLVIIVVVVPTVLVVVSLAAEVERAVAGLRAWAEGRTLAVPGWVQRIPWVGPALAERAERLLAEPALVQQWALPQIGPWARNLAAVAGNLGLMVVDAALSLLTLFFLYQHGSLLAAQIDRVAHRLAGDRVHAMLAPLTDAVRAVMYGMVFTALAQGGLGMLGYWIAGLGAPVLLGALTAIASFLPLGAPLVFVPAALWLMVEGRLIAGFALLAWGVIAISSADNVVRSWFISGATRAPFLLVFFGVVGGMAAFGSIGLVVGPVAVAVLLELWREWSAEPA
jgi:predicted PurR-regulated permease PerM